MRIAQKPHITVSPSVKRRLDIMRDEKQEALDGTRTVSLGEIISDLLAEHDNAMEAEPR